MPCIKIVDKPYENYTDTYHLIHKYIFPKSKYIGGLAVDPVYAAEQMDFCRHIWSKNTGVKLRHFILTYSEYETNNLMNAELLHTMHMKFVIYMKMIIRLSLEFTITRISFMYIL